MFTDRFNLNTKLLGPNFRFKDACTSRLKTRLRLCQGHVCVSCHWTLQCLYRGCFRVPFEDVSTSQSGTFPHLKCVMNRTCSLSYLHLLGTSSWKDAVTSGTHLCLGPDCSSSWSPRAHMLGCINPFLYATPWILGGGKSIFTVVIH